ncbi:DUF4252 domain-containing protein [Spongiimicrobium salis]|uniref:DUF4252 domain-containing protein n=1 Tax=Spongiimicrobium salis TaxID=1667022 RepID=UPI00374D5244
MKKIIVVLLIAIAPFSGFSQSIFDKFEEMDEVGAVIINKGMIDLLVKMGDGHGDEEAQEFMDMAKNINGVKVFTTENSGVAAQMNAAVKKHLRSASLEELMRVKDKDANVKFYIKNGKRKDHVSELLMFVSGLKDLKVEGRNFETVLVSITGDIDLNKIGTLTKKMNLPKEMKKAGGK